MFTGTEEETTTILSSHEFPSGKVSEASLYPLWEASRHRDFPSSSGEILHILSPGIRNSGKGPDYRNCFFRKKGRKRVQACDVEIHVKASDWTTHQHHKDPNYGKVLLHVFLVLDTDLTRLHYHNIYHIPFPSYRQPREPLKLPSARSCEGNGDFHSPEKRTALAELGYRKLLEKGLRIHRSLQHRTVSLMAGILRVHGQTKNSEIFLDTGVTVLDALLRKKDLLSTKDIHIVLAGSSRLLHALMEKKRTGMVSRELLFNYLEGWTHLQKEHGFREIPYAPWDFHSIRPLHHPFTRFLQFAIWLKSVNLDSLISDINALHIGQKEIEPHFVLGERLLSNAPDRPLSYSRQMVELLVIDGIIPWLLAQRVGKKKNVLKETLRCFPQRFPANSKTEFFIQNVPRCYKGFTFLEAQGLLRLHDEFCLFRDISCAGCTFHRN